MSPQSLSLCALFPLGFLVLVDGPASTIALWGLLITTAGGLIGRWLDNRREQRRRDWELQDRAYQAGVIRQDLLKHRDELAKAIAAKESTVIDQTKEPASGD